MMKQERKGRREEDAEDQLTAGTTENAVTTDCGVVGDFDHLLKLWPNWEYQLRCDWPSRSSLARDATKLVRCCVQKRPNPASVTLWHLHRCQGPQHHRDPSLVGTQAWNGKQPSTMTPHCPITFNRTGDGDLEVRLGNLSADADHLKIEEVKRYGSVDGCTPPRTSGRQRW